MAEPLHCQAELLRDRGRKPPSGLSGSPLGSITLIFRDSAHPLRKGEKTHAGQARSWEPCREADLVALRREAMGAPQAGLPVPASPTTPLIFRTCTRVPQSSRSAPLLPVVLDAAGLRPFPEDSQPWDPSLLAASVFVGAQPLQGLRGEHHWPLPQAKLTARQEPCSANPLLQAP